jgi:hypothetical protein
MVEYPSAEIVEIDFYNYETWLTWAKENTPRQAVDIMAYTTVHGLWEPLTKRFFPRDQIQWDVTNPRESGLAAGLNSRMRATLYALHACLGHLNPYDSKIYAAEALTDLALLLRGRFTKFLGSEYTADPAVAEALFPIPNEDLMALSFKDASFHVVMTNEVLEHVPSIDAALSEMARVLKPGGWHIGTCPFRVTDRASQVRTKLENGQLVHLMEPEWHGDPMGTGGSLVFEVPGWDILDRAKAAGFSCAFWKHIQSPTFGITGVFVLCLRK